MPIDQAEFNSAMATYLAATDHSIALRRGIASALPSGLLQGEPYYATDTKRIHVGHGDTTAKQIPNVDDISAANLLTAIKTVDGAGSGLDADLLDGHSSAYFTPSVPNQTFTNTVTVVFGATAHGGLYYSSMIPLPNADLYTITIVSIAVLDGAGANSGTTSVLNKTNIGFQITNDDASVAGEAAFVNFSIALT